MTQTACQPAIETITLQDAIDEISTISDGSAPSQQEAPTEQYTDEEIRAIQNQVRSLMARIH